LEYIVQDPKEVFEALKDERNQQKINKWLGKPLVWDVEEIEEKAEDGITEKRVRIAVKEK